MLDRKDIDAVIVATGEFQRVLPCIHACQAGKDVYAEKPLTLYIREGRVLVDAVRKHERVFQVGSQQRSMAMNRIACELVRSGGLGKVMEVRAINYTGPEPSPAAAVARRAGAGRARLGRVAEPGRLRDPSTGSGWAGCGWRDFSGGEMTNWGAHGVDQIQWALGMDDTGPVELWPLTAGPNGQVGHALCQRRARSTSCSSRARVRWAARSSSARRASSRSTATSSPPTRRRSPPSCSRRSTWPKRNGSGATTLALWQARWHMQNWLDCIRTRAEARGRRRDRPPLDHASATWPISPVRSAAACTGIPAEQFIGDDEANSYLDRPRRKGYELPDIA